MKLLTTTDDGRTPDHEYPIAFGSGELIIGYQFKRTTLIWNKIQNLETVSGSFRPWSFWSGHFGQSHFGQLLVVTTLIGGSFQPYFEVGHWALSRLVKIMLVVV